MDETKNPLDDESNDQLIDDFCNKVNTQEYKDIQTAKVIRSNFVSLNDILEELNETKIFYENPDLKLVKTIKKKLQIITPTKDLNIEDLNLIKDIKTFQEGFEENAEQTINTIDNVKKNFADLSKSVKNLIEAIEKTKVEYFDTLRDMIKPIIVEVEKIENIDKSKLNKEKMVNYNDRKNKLDKSIKPYDEKLAAIIKEKKDILNQIKDNIKLYIDLLNSLDKPINSMIEKMEKIFDTFEEKSNNFINIIYNYKNAEEKKQASAIFREILKLNSDMSHILEENEKELKLQNEDIKNKKKQCNDDLDKIRANNMNSSEKLNQLQEESQNIMKEINDFLKFLNIEKVKYPLKELKGLNLYHIKKQVNEGTENIMKANQKLEADFTKLKKFVDEKVGGISNVFTLDLAFIMDITGSMGSYLDFAKKQIITVINKIMEDTTVIVKLGFVGYRDDLDSKDEYIVFPEFTKELELVKNFISSSKVGGGGDCEDMGGGLTRGLEYKWKSRTRFAMLIADVPCHGVKYHGVPNYDSYPDGDPRYKIDEIVKKYASKNINLLCLNIKNETRTLYENFKKYYESGKKPNSNSEIIVRDFKEEASKLTDIIVSKAKELYEKRHETTIIDDDE